MVAIKTLVPMISHAKYQISIINISEDMSQVKGFVTDRRTDGQTERWTNEFRCSPLSRKAGGNNILANPSKMYPDCKTSQRDVSITIRLTKSQTKKCDWIIKIRPLC